MNSSTLDKIVTIPPGKKQWIRQSFTGANGQSFVVSVGVVRGTKPGPVFANVAGQHGMEHMGPIILRDFFDELDPVTIAGTVYLCPCANPLALAYNFEVFPEDQALPEPGTKDLRPEMFGIKERDDYAALNMNRCWPDDIAQDPPPNSREGVATQVTRWLWKTMIEPADIVLDHHSVRSTRKPYIFCEEPVIPWTPFLGLEGVQCTGPLAPEPTAYPYRRLSLQAIRHSKIGICIEYSVQFVIREEDRPIGRFALLNMMKAMGMLKGQPQIPKQVWLIPGPYWEHYEEMKAATVGHLHFSVEDYQWVQRGQEIVRIMDLQTNELKERITAPCDGLMLDRHPLAVSRSGDCVCRFSKDARLLAQPGKPYPIPNLPRRRTSR